MGCDIHLYTERKYEREGKYPIWICRDHYILNEYYILYPEFENEKEYKIKPIYNNRDYTLFAALVGVRNDGTIEPISAPRGLPEDVSRVVYQESQSWGSDGHSHSWLTAAELFRYQSDHPTTKYEGILTPENLQKFDETGEPPTSQCSWTSIKGAEKRLWTVEGSPVDSLVDAVRKRMSEEFYISDFLEEDEKKEKFQNNADKFRIVFWFDN